MGDNEEMLYLKYTELKSVYTGGYVYRGHKSGYSWFLFKSMLERKSNGYVRMGGSYKV
jgi:hypothetical protein